MYSNQAIKASNGFTAKPQDNCAQQGQGVAIPVQITLIANAAMRIEERVAHLQHQVFRLQSVCDRIFNAQAEDPNPAPATAPTCEGHRLEQSIEFFDGVLARFNQQLERIERV